MHFFIHLKKRFPFLWRFIEDINGYLVKWLYSDNIQQQAQLILEDYKNEPVEYRLINRDELDDLHCLLSGQDSEQLKYFNPHSFDKSTLQRLYDNSSFLMMGVYDNKHLIGYFFLRCFVNKTCFVGKLVDRAYQGRGIAKRMGKIAQNIAWSSGFRVFGTSSKHNIKSLNSSKATNDFKLIRELADNYIYYEYLQSGEKTLH